jgi:radical SAM protein with 4Fe4S-binding SPASM domain
MRIVDCVLKVREPVGWLYHTASSYKVRMDTVALRTLEGLLSKPGPDGLSEPEALIHERLSRRGLLVADGPSEGLPLLRKSPLKTLDLEFSSRCNLECHHCFAALDRKTHMSRETLDRIFDGVSDLEPVTMVLNGGEPLLNPEWRYAVEEGRRRGLRIVMYTNGTLVTEEVASFMAKHRVAKASISLDGFEAQNDAMRGSRAFQRTTAGIKRLTSRGIQVFVSTMVSEETLARKADFQRFCLEELGVTSVQFSAVVPIGKGSGAPATFQVHDSALREMYGTDPSQAEAEEGPAGDKAWACEAGVEQIFIAADGQVYSCHYFQNLHEPMGDLAKGSLSEIYRTSLAGEVAARTPWMELPVCKSCPALKACKTGCRARAKLLAGSFDAPDPQSCRIHGCRPAA